MWHKVLAIGENAFKELIRKKVISILVVSILVCFVFPTYFHVSFHGSFGSSGPTGLGLQDFLAIQLNVFLFIGWLSAIQFAAGSIDAEITRRSLTSVLIRPLERSEYLLGRALGIIAFFAIFILIGLVVAYSTAVLRGFQIPPQFLMAFGETFCSGIFWIVLALSLGAVTSPAGAIMTIILGGILTTVVPFIPTDLHPLVPWIQKVFHYLVPEMASAFKFSKGMSMGDSSLKAALMEAAKLLDQLMYAGLVFLACAWIFQKRDLTLRENA